MRTAIGIDLGTTYSAIAIMQDGKPTIPVFGSFK